MESQTKVARGATSLYIANVVVLVANTLYFLVLTNFLRSTKDVGIVTALNITIWLLVTVCILAQPVTVQSPIPAPLAVLKFLPALLTRNARNDVVKVFRGSLVSAAILSGVFFATLFVRPDLIIPFLGGEAVLPEFVRLAAGDVFLLSLGQVCLGTLIALGDLRTATVYIVGWSMARYIIASLLLVPYSIVGVLVGWIIGDAILLVVALRKSASTIRAGSEPASFSLHELTRYSLYTLFSALIGFAINQADKIFTLASQGLGQLAIYNVAIVAASFTGFAPYALITVLLPALSALHSSNRVEEMRNMIRIYTRYVAIVVLPVAFGFASVTEVALRIFGPTYTAGFFPTVIVSIATGLTAIGAVYAGALLALGRLRWYTAANLLGLLVLFAVSALSTGILGISGPALGRAALMVTAAVVYAIALRRSGFLEIDSKAFLIAALGSGAMGLVVFMILSALPTFLLKLAVLPFLVVMGVGLYLGCLRLLHLPTTSDLDFVGSILPRRLHPLIPIVGKLLGVKPDT